MHFLSGILQLLTLDGGVFEVHQRVQRIYENGGVTNPLTIDLYFKPSHKLFTMDIPYTGYMKGLSKIS